MCAGRAIMVNAHEVKPVWAVRGSSLAVLKRSVYSFCCVSACVADVGVDCAVVINQINDDYYLCFVTTNY